MLDCVFLDTTLLVLAPNFVRAERLNKLVFSDYCTTRTAEVYGKSMHSRPLPICVFLRSNTPR